MIVSLLDQHVPDVISLIAMATCFKPLSASHYVERGLWDHFVLLDDNLLLSLAGGALMPLP